MARKKASSNYFTKETEEYIKKYNLSTDSDYRAKIFTDHIYFPLAVSVSELTLALALS